MERKHLWLLVLRGVIAIVFGLLALLLPGVTVVALALLFGAYIVATGIVTIITGFRRAHDAAQRTAYLVAGLISVAAGVIALLWPGVTALVLALLFAAWVVVTGIMDIWAASRVRGQWLMIVLGVLSVVAGVFVVARPTLGVVALAVVVGVYALLIGVLLLAEAWREYRSGHAPTRRPAPAAG